MKILWLCPEIPYPLTSGLLRVYSLLRELGQRHEITFVSLSTRKMIPLETMRALAPYTKSVTIHSTWTREEPGIIRLLGKIPFLGLRIQAAWRTHRASADMSATVEELTRKQEFDVVLFGGRYRIPALERLHIPLVVDCCDADSARFLGEMWHAPLIRRPIIFMRYLLMKRREVKMTRMSRYVSFISDRDRKALVGQSARCEILQQGVDFEYWQPSEVQRQPNLIVFTGAMDYSPNDDGARFLIEGVLPLVRQAVSDIQVLIVGRDPLPALIKTAEPYSDVRVTGAVPDVRPYLERASVYVAPLRFASGVQNKVLEAMAMELPVVTTPVVADALLWDGLRAPVVIGRKAHEIAEQIIELLADSKRRTALGQKGREFVVQHCRWSQSAEKLESMCLTAIMENASHAESPVRAEQCA